LAAFARAIARLEEEGIGVVAASTDARDKAEATVKEHSITYPVGYGLPLEETAATLGAFYEPTRRVLHATGFVVNPDATIAVAQYSSGPIGRLVWQDVVALVQVRRKQTK
jgi:peroxiredoxin